MTTDYEQEPVECQFKSSTREPEVVVSKTVIFVPISESKTSYVVHKICLLPTYKQIGNSIEPDSSVLPASLCSSTLLTESPDNHSNSTGDPRSLQQAKTWVDSCIANYSSCNRPGLQRFSMKSEAAESHTLESEDLEL